MAAGHWSAVEPWRLDLGGGTSVGSDLDGGTWVGSGALAAGPGSALGPWWRDLGRQWGLGGGTSAGGHEGVRVSESGGGRRAAQKPGSIVRPFCSAPSTGSSADSRLYRAVPAHCRLNTRLHLPRRSAQRHMRKVRTVGRRQKVSTTRQSTAHCPQISAEVDLPKFTLESEPNTIARCGRNGWCGFVTVITLSNPCDQPLPNVTRPAKTSPSGIMEFSIPGTMKPTY